MTGPEPYDGDLEAEEDPADRPYDDADRDQWPDDLTADDLAAMGLRRQRDLRAGGDIL